MSIIFYRAVQAGHHVLVLQEDLGLQLVQGNLGIQDFLCLQADPECLDLEARGLLSLRLIQRIL